MSPVIGQLDKPITTRIWGRDSESPKIVFFAPDLPNDTTDTFDMVAYNSKTTHGVEMKFGRVVENHKIINLV